MSYDVDEARSDLFLSGAVFLFGPLIIDIVLGLIPIMRIPGAAPVLTVTLPLVTTLLVPLLLMRYRGESLRSLGFHGGLDALWLGIVVAVPLVVASVLLALVQQGDVLGAFPLTRGRLVPLLGHVAGWVGLGGLGTYMAVKAADAFRSQYLPLRSGIVDIGRIVTAAAGIAALLLVLALAARGAAVRELAGLVLLPLGLAGSLLIGLRSLREQAATTWAILLTVVVIFALRPFILSFQALPFVFGIYDAALHAGVGLLLVAFLEARRSAWAGMGLVLTVALFTQVGVRFL